MSTQLTNRLKKLESRLNPTLSPEEQELCKTIRERRLKVFGEEECRIRDAFHEKHPLPPSNDIATLILAARKTLPLYEEFKKEYKKIINLL